MLVFSNIESIHCVVLILSYVPEHKALGQNNHCDIMSNVMWEDNIIMNHYHSYTKQIHSIMLQITVGVLTYTWAAVNVHMGCC